MEDSLLLWKSIVSNKLLCNVNIILFLNKCDLLQVCRLQPSTFILFKFYQAKLDAGVRLNQHMVSYSNRPNDYDSVSNCVFVWFKSDPVLILFQILGINLVPSISRTPRTESESYTVRLFYALVSRELIRTTRKVHLTSVTDTRRTHAVISSGKVTPVSHRLVSSAHSCPSPRLHSEIEYENGRLYVIHSPSTHPSSHELCLNLIYSHTIRCDFLWYCPRY